MKRIVLIALLLNAVAAFSAPAIIKMDFVVKTKEIGKVSSTIIVREGNEGTMSSINENKTTTISAVPTYTDIPSGGRGILVDMKINANGKISSPQMIVKEGALATFSVASPENKNEIELELVATTVKEDK